MKKRFFTAVESTGSHGELCKDVRGIERCTSNITAGS
jgi:hypothetical protein